MKKLLFMSAVLSAFTCSPTAWASVKVIGQSVDKDEICPGAATSKCVINSVGTTTTYIGSSVKYIDLDASGAPILDDYLGHLFNANMAKGQPYCQSKGDNVLKQFATTAGIPYLRENQPYANKFRITIKAKEVIGLGSNINLAEVVKDFSLVGSDLDQVTAAITASYDKARNKDVELWGWFRFYEINPDILTKMNAADAPATLKACKEWLTQNNQKLTWSLTGYKLDEAKVTTGFSSTFRANLKAELQGKLTDAQIASITAAYNNEVQRAAEVTVSSTFGLLTVGRAPL